tara:strand:+ start:4979 stop:6301 length:1323 start_codon:yes stop_codon:yes gene_type:complete
VAKKIYILDTCVYLTDADSINAYGNNDIVIPLKVLEEIDKHKKRQDGAGANARKIIRMLDELRSKGSLRKGVRLARGKGIVRACPYETSTIPSVFDIKNADNEIIGVALREQEQNPKRKVIVVSRDINMRVKCDALGLPAEEYIDNKVVESLDFLYTGFLSHLIDDEIVNQFYDSKDIMLDPSEVKIHPNQFIMLVSNSNDKKTALAKFVDYNKPLLKIGDYGKKGIWGVRPRNKEQSFALDLLMDAEVPIVTLVGKAGCGKTLLAIAAGLEQVIERNKETPYTRLIITRPVQPLGRDIGYLPGTLEEKMLPWLTPIQDNLRYLLGNDKTTLSMYIDNGHIEVEALTYIRGRSIANAYLIIDEAQNLTKHELKTIITRVGEGTKIVFTGDVEQIDNLYIDETSNGLTYAVEKFKEHDIAGHVNLQRGERSKVATLASKIL